jgi:hypothetical protein
MLLKVQNDLDARFNSSIDTKKQSASDLICCPSYSSHPDIRIFVLGRIIGKDEQVVDRVSLDTFVHLLCVVRSSNAWQH